jgi:hypothetical protein
MMPQKVAGVPKIKDRKCWNDECLLAERTLLHSHLADKQSDCYHLANEVVTNCRFDSNLSVIATAFASRHSFAR